MSRLSASQRKKLPRSAFAEPGKLAYPIHDLAHARNALARVAQYGSPAEQTEVRTAVHRRYPQLAKQIERHYTRLHG